jgi:Mg2+/citrate symporter
MNAERERERERERDRQTDRQTDRQRQTKTETQRNRQRQKMWGVVRLSCISVLKLFIVTAILLGFFVCLFCFCFVLFFKNTVVFQKATG